jgi:hypothetical protein
MRLPAVSGMPVICPAMVARVWIGAGAFEQGGDAAPAFGGGGGSGRGGRPSREMRLMPKTM